MTRSPESTTQTTSQTESQASNQEASPLFDALMLEYIQNSGVSDLETVKSDTGAAVAVLLEGVGNDAARNEYKDALNAIPLAATENEIPDHLEMAYRAARQLDPTFPRVAAIYQSGKKTYWNAGIGIDEETTGLAIVSDSRGIRLGENEKAGFIDELLPGHKIVIADNRLLDQLELNNALTLKGVVNDEGSRELYPLYGAVLVSGNNLGSHNEQVHTEASQQVNAPEENMISAAERRRNARRIRDERRAKQSGDTAPANDDDNPPDSDITKAFADKIQAQIDAMNTAPTLGFSEMVRLEMEKAEAAEKQRLAARVEKYTQKVASYEELATEALGRRMKGRLFSPLTRKNKNEARKDDQYMHLLEGYSRVLDAALMQQWLTEGHSDDEVATKIYEHQQTRQEARAARNHEELRKDKLGSFLDKYANMSKGKKIGVTIGAAAVFGVLSVGLGAVGAVGGVAAIGGGVLVAGAKVTKTFYQHRSKMYETRNQDPLRSPDKLVSVENGKATTRTAIEQVFAGRQYDEKKREKAIQKADRNKKVAAGLAAASAIGIGAMGAGVVMEHADAIQEFWSKPPMPDVSTEIGNADGSWVTEAPVVEPAPAPTPFEFSADASTVTDGEGWYQTIQETTGVTDPGQQAAILQKIGPALQEKGWAYPMSDGTWGISRPGTLPKDVLELIKNSR